MNNCVVREVRVAAAAPRITSSHYCVPSSYLTVTTATYLMYSTCTCMYPFGRFDATRPSSVVVSALRASFSAFLARYNTPRSFARKNNSESVFCRGLTHLERTNKCHVRSDPYTTRLCTPLQPQNLTTSTIVRAKAYYTAFSNNLHLFPHPHPHISAELHIFQITSSDQEHRLTWACSIKKKKQGV
jgi:hypothetical protein